MPFIPTPATDTFCVHAGKLPRRLFPGSVGTSSTFSIQAIPHWYAALNKPSFRPPTPHLWTGLDAVVCTDGDRSLVGMESTHKPAEKFRIENLFWLQLFLNFAWSWIFFHQHQLAGALLEIVLLWLASTSGGYRTLLARFQVTDGNGYGASLSRLGSLRHPPEL